MTKTREVFYVVLCKHNLNWLKKIHIWWQKIESKSKALFKRASKNAYNKLRTPKLVVFSTHFLCFSQLFGISLFCTEPLPKLKNPLKLPLFCVYPASWLGFGSEVGCGTVFWPVESLPQGTECRPGKRPPGPTSNGVRWQAKAGSTLLIY